MHNYISFGEPITDNEKQHIAVGKLYYPDEDGFIPLSEYSRTNLSKNTIYVNMLEEKDANLPIEYIVDDSHRKLLPYNTRQAGGHSNRVFLSGATLCGKSYLAGFLIGDYRRQFPENNIVIISTLEGDSSYKFMDNWENVFKIGIDNRWLTHPPTLDEFSDSIVVFDDYKSANKNIVKAIDKFRDDCLQAGRHKNIDVLICSQIIFGGLDTKSVHINSFQIVGYPQGAGKHQLSNFLRCYMKFKKPLIDKIMNLPSRWILINKGNTPYILHEKGCFFY